MDPMNMYFLRKWGLFHCYVRLPKGIFSFQRRFCGKGFGTEGAVGIPTTWSGDSHRVFVGGWGSEVCTKQTLIPALGIDLVLVF